MCKIYNRISVLGIVCHIGSWIKKLAFENFGVSKTLLKKHKKLTVSGGVRLMNQQWSRVFAAEFQKLRYFPTTLDIAHKVSKTSSDWGVDASAMTAFHEAWDERIKSFEAQRKLFKASYQDMREEMLAQHREMFEDILSENPELGPTFVEDTLLIVSRAYPLVTEIDKIIYAEMIPSPLMALFNVTPEGEAFQDTLESMGAEMREKYIEMAKLDSKILQASHQQAWRGSIVESLATLKKASEEGKIKGQTINSVRLFLTRHPLSDYFHEDKIQKMLADLLGLLPEDDPKAIKPNKILAKITQIEREIKKGSAAIKKEISQAKGARRKIKVF